MDLLKNNTDYLIFQCDPRCTHLGGKEYVIDCSETPLNTEFPKCISFSIQFKILDINLHRMIETWLCTFSDEEIDVKKATFSDDEIDVKKANLMKDEFKDQYNIGLKDYQQRLDKLKDLLEQIDELNLEVETEEILECINMYYGPADWYRSAYIVNCHSGTRFYNMLKESGFLEKYLSVS